MHSCKGAKANFATKMTTTTTPASSHVIRTAVANGKIPICFEMLDTEITSLHRPSPFYVMAPRQSYLPLASRAAREIFKESAPEVGEFGVWYETNGDNKVPLRWNVPLGVLYDLFGNGALPWRVLIRFQGFPKSLLVSCTNEADVEASFFNSFKQALSLRFGNAKRFMELPKQDQEQLWEGVALSRWDDYRSALFSVIEPNAPSSQNAAVRMFSTNQPQKMLQVPISLAGSVTLGDALRKFGFAGEKETVVVVQGVTPPLTTPLAELCAEMCAYDLFLYCVVQHHHVQQQQQ